MAKSPLLVVNYTDPQENIKGYLVINDLKDGLAAGGMRIQKGLKVETLMELANNMTFKQRAAGIDVGGAKSGLDMDPEHPRRDAVVKGFLMALRPLLLECYNMGPDLNTTMADLERIAKSCDIPSLKLAVGRRRGLTDAEFLRRYNLFENKSGIMSINQLRAPQTVATCVTSLLGHLKLNKANAKICIQGAGNMGAGLAYLLTRAGVKISGWSDSEKCYIDPKGLPVEKLLMESKNGILPSNVGLKIVPRDELLKENCDVLVLAAISRAFGHERVNDLQCKAIVEAANLALEPDVEEKFHQRGIIVIPDLIASVGGSIAVQATYKTNPQTGEDILKYVDQVTEKLCSKLFTDLKNPPRETVLKWGQ